MRELRERFGYSFDYFSQLLGPCFFTIDRFAAASIEATAGHPFLWLSRRMFDFLRLRVRESELEGSLVRFLLLESSFPVVSFCV